MNAPTGEAVAAAVAIAYQQRLDAVRGAVAAGLARAQTMIAAARRPAGAAALEPGVPAGRTPAMFRVEAVGASGLQQLVRAPEGVALKDAVAQAHRDFGVWQERCRAGEPAGGGGPRLAGKL